MTGTAVTTASAKVQTPEEALQRLIGVLNHLDANKPILAKGVRDLAQRYGKGMDDESLKSLTALIHEAVRDPKGPILMIPCNMLARFYRRT